MSDQVAAVERHESMVTPPILMGAGPQMEDYPDFDSWLFARRLYAMEKLGIEVNPEMKTAAERSRLR